MAQETEQRVMIDCTKKNKYQIAGNTLMKAVFEMEYYHH
jgi:hypothetical protein